MGSASSAPIREVSTFPTPPRGACRVNRKKKGRTTLKVAFHFVGECQEVGGNQAAFDTYLNTEVRMAEDPAARQLQKEIGDLQSKTKDPLVFAESDRPEA